MNFYNKIKIKKYFQFLLSIAGFLFVLNSNLNIFASSADWDLWDGWGNQVIDTPASEMITITFDLNGGTFGGTSNVSVSIPRGDMLSLSQIPTPTRAGFIFNGWSQDLLFTPLYVSAYVHAIWIPSQGAVAITPNNEVRVVFNLSGGNIFGDTSSQVVWVSVGNVINFNQIPQAPTRAGFLFNGWSPNISGNVITANTHVTAQWIPIPNQNINVTFNLNGGSINGAAQSVVRTIPSGSAFPANLIPPTPIRPGYIFNGWSQNVANIVLNNNIAISANWIQNQPQNINITFRLNGGIINGSGADVYRTVQSGNILLANQYPQNPTRAGYIFNGWNPSISNVPLYGAQTIVAQWIPSPAPAIIPTVSEPVRLFGNGQVLVGNNTLTYDPNIFGSVHITEEGISVLPARLSLAILFGITPAESLTSDLLLWNNENRTLTIDPNGRNIRLTVGSNTMQVGGISRPILSGSGAGAEPTQIFIQPTTGRMFLPTYALASALGFTVSWDATLGATVLTPPSPR